MMVHLEYHPCISNINKNTIHGCCGSVYFVDSNCLEFCVSIELKQLKTSHNFQFRVPPEQWKTAKLCLGRLKQHSK